MVNEHVLTSTFPTCRSHMKLPEFKKDRNIHTHLALFEAATEDIHSKRA